MIAVLVLAFSLAHDAGGAASSVTSATSATSVTSVLQGTDQVPSAAAIQSVPVEVLVAVVGDTGQLPLYRARAARLLGTRGIDALAIDAALEEVRRRTRGALAAQLTLALADRAHARGNRDAVIAIAEAAVGSVDVAVARAGAVLWWRIGGERGRRRLEVLAATHPDEGVRGACRGRLRVWGASGGADGRPTVIDRPHGGPPPAR